MSEINPKPKEEQKREKSEEKNKEVTENKENKEGKSENKQEKKELMFPRLAVFGATGDTGVQFVKRALTAGHSVTALVRDETKFYKLIPKHDRLRVIKGDISDQKNVDTVMQNQDAVVSCLGAHGTSPWNKTKLYTKSVSTMVKGMKSQSVRRILIVTSWATQLKNDGTNPFLFEWILKPTIAAGFITDMGECELDLMKTDLDYTIVRPPGLSNDEATGRWVAEEGYTVKKTPQSMIPYISRGDVAQFMLDECLHQNQWIKKGVAIGPLKKKK